MRYITRTIKTTLAITKCVDTETMDIVDKTFTLGNTPAEKVARVINKMLDGTTMKLVKIVDITTDTAKYKISEEVFIENAEVVE